VKCKNKEKFILFEKLDCTSILLYHYFFILRLILITQYLAVDKRDIILFDGGYKGIHRFIPNTVIPHIKKPDRNLSPEKEKENSEKAELRSAVERRFAALVNKFDILIKR
jgi:hypothetical protein